MGENTNKKDRIRVLLVDDETGYLNVLSNRLSRRNFTVITASSGASALKKLRKTDVDVAVVDLKLGDMDGIELLKIIRLMAEDLPVIILTGHGCQEAAGGGIAAGAFDYLTKPCNLDDLMDKIKSAHKSAATAKQFRST